ncbi:MAG TPA: hypothetical protein VK589_30165 [Chryseolinea sp.]|nr:hypothetical protein [Chryseolinea sp.]
MAALSFKQRFAGKIRNGQKRQTIRAIRKYPITPGETLYLYVGQRTKHCEKLREVKCSHTKPISIYFNVVVDRIVIDNTLTLDELMDLDWFAKSDGFRDWNDMRDFWIENHPGKGSFHGQLITW